MLTVLQHRQMRRTFLATLAAVTFLTAMASCSPSTRISLRNQTGSEISTQINGKPIRLATGQTSKTFILAWGNQGDWNKEVQAGDCAYLYMAVGSARELNLPRPDMFRKPTVLVLDSDFRLTATSQNGEPLGAVMPERRCR